jgi:hypothetical protein
MNNRIKWHGHVLRMNKDLNQEKVLSMEPKGKCPRGRPKLRWEKQVRKVVTQNKGRT